MAIQVLAGLLRPDQVTEFLSNHTVREGATRTQQPRTTDRPHFYSFGTAPMIIQSIYIDTFNMVDISWSPVLRDLADVGDRLERLFWWSAEKATYFVLTGVAPQPREIVSYTDVRTFGPPVIMLGVDPRTSAREVMARYEEERQRLVKRGDLAKASAKSRPIGKRAARLAVFIDARIGTPWAAVRAEWNSVYPAWISHDDRTFASDGRRAWERVTGKPFPSKLRVRP